MTSRENQKLSFFSNKPAAIQRMALRILTIVCLLLAGHCAVKTAFGQTLGLWSSYLVSTNAYWDVTDITDPGQPVGMGELQAPFCAPGYALYPNTPPGNTPWHVEGSIPGIQLSQAFGTATSGGAFGQGAVYAMTVITNTQNFSPNQLILAGNVLYGTTSGNGKSDGTVFKVNTDGSDFITLHTFTGSDGASPQAGLVLANGVLYGTTYQGGTGSHGVVFSINTDGTGFSILHAFTGGSDGGYCTAGLVVSGSVLYGTTEGGGTASDGVVFSINTNGTGFSVLHAFTGSDGEYPEAGLAYSNGALYGTTYEGGANGVGVVFTIDANGNGFAVLHSFGTIANDGGYCKAGLVVSGGVLYGTTEGGGADHDGVVFSISTGGNGFSILHSFADNSSDGGFPVAGLVLANGVLYGTTLAGGTDYSGTIYSINTDGSYADLYSFTVGNDGEDHRNGLVVSNGVLYGSSYDDGASGNGTLFSINIAGGNIVILTSFPPPNTYIVTTIHSFSGVGGDGADPNSQLAISGSTFVGAAPVLYGTTSGGGAYGYGTIFAMNTNGSGYSVLYSFSSSSRVPQNRLLISGNTLYGTTTTTVFKINTDGSGFTTLASINGASELILSLSGTNLYGTTANGGANNLGMVFSLSTDGSVFKDLHDFSGGSDGASPNAGLDLSPNAFYYGQTISVLYGTTKGGGTAGNGTVFSINTDGSSYKTLYAFGSTSGDGAQPEAGLILSPTYSGEDLNNPARIDTFLCGTTFAGGAYGLGTVFSINTDGSGFSTLYSFSGPDGSGPNGKLALLGAPSAPLPPKPVLMGTTSGGGAYGKGTIFILSNGVFNCTHNFSGSSYGAPPDFSGNSDGASPAAGITLAVGDYSDSVWSLDTTLNISDPTQIPYIYFSMALDNYVELYVNGQFVYSDNWDGQNPWQSAVSLQSYLQAGPNDIRVLIGGDGDDNDYFTMAIFNNNENYTPTAPTGLNAVAGNGEVFLAWDPVGGATGYNIYRSTTSGGTYTLIGNTTPTTTQTTYADTTAVNGTTYYYEVQAVDVSAYSPNSSPVGPVTPEPAPLSAPNGLTATASYTQVLLTWDSVSGATGYNVYRSTISGGAYTRIGNTTPTTTQTTYTDTQVASGTTYYYVVSAVDGDVESPYSAEVNATPGGAVLVGYWPFNEASGTVLHDTVNGDNGTIYNGTWDSGISGSDLDFDGSSTYVAIPSTANLNFRTAAFSISLWFSGQAPLPGSRDPYPAILSNNPGGWESGCFALRFGNLLKSDFTVHWNPEGDPVLDSGTLTQQRWHNAVVIRNGSTITLYIDAVPVATRSISATDPIDLGSGGYMLLGGNTWDGSFSYYLGSLEQLSIYQGALTQSQITSLYEAVPLPSITTQPQSQTVIALSTVTFSVTATGAQSYQWQLNGVNIPGATDSTYTIDSVTTGNVGNYTVVVSNSGGSVTSAAAALVINATLVGYWPFDEASGTVLHDTVNGDNGTIYNGTWDSGISGSDLDFNGNSTYVAIPSTANLNFGTAAFSISLWFSGDTFSGPGSSDPYPAILSNNPGYWESGCFALRFGNKGNDDFTVHWNPEGDPILDSGTLSEQRWHHAVVIRSGNTIYLYIDAVLVKTEPVSATDMIDLGNGGNMLLGGNTWDGVLGYYRGSLEQLRIYQGALTQAQITSLYEDVPPPSITTQPQSQTVVAGSTVTFSVLATGAQTYQWQFNGVNIFGATGSSYTISSAASVNAGNYTVVVSNPDGTVNSTSATLAINPAVLVGYWPFNEGSGTVLHDTVNGDNGTIYNGTWDSGISGSDLDFDGSSTYVAIPSTANLNFGAGPFSISYWFFGGPLASQGNSYPAILSNNPGSWESGCFALRWQNLGNDDFTVHWNPEGDPILDSGTLSEQRWHHAVVIRSANTIYLYIDAILIKTEPVSATDTIDLGNGGNMLLGGNTWDGADSYYRGSLEQLRIYQGALTQAQITSLYDSVPLPTITTPPQSQTATAGSGVTFSVAATGAQSYQWQFNGVNISGATGPAYTIPSVAVGNGGNYSVVVSNPAGSTSASATLAVPVGYWPFNEGSGTQLDDTVNGDNGTINNGTWDSGISGSDLDFNGSSTYVAIPYNANLNFGTGPFSISVWFYGGPHDQGLYPAILSNNPGSWKSGSFALRWQNNWHSDFTVHLNPENDPVLDSGTLNQHQWYNAVVVRNGTTISLYIDGTLTKTATIKATDSVNLGNGGSMLLGGNTWDGAGSYFQGSLERLRIYQGPLAQTQITSLFNNP